MSTQDQAPSFKVRVNLVQVRVVVRDKDGHVVENLRKEDFQLFDNKKPQVISTFNVETPASKAVVPNSPSPDPNSPDAAVSPAKVILPQRFAALVFDDLHLNMDDAMTSRVAALKFLDALQPSDRVALYVTSGQLEQDFTSDRELLKKAIAQISPRPLYGGDTQDCPDINHYQADLIVNQHDQQALAVSTEDALVCAFNGDTRQYQGAAILAQSAAMRALNAGDTQAQYAYRHLEDVIRRLAIMPGQRILVFASPGFLLTTNRLDSTDIVDRAVRSNIVIDTLDARGLYVPDVGDISQPAPRGSYKTTGYRLTYHIAAQSAQSEVLAQFADGTGGTFFHNRNDLDEGFKQAVATPPLSYLLGFSPQNLKLDGRFHLLKVTLANKLKYSVQARHGYFAPRTANDPTETAKQEIQEAIFSQEEIRDLPVELQTQFFKKDQTEARLAVLTRLDLKGIRFKKAEGRNNDDVTIATAIFDENGNFVTGGEKILQMKLLDTTYDRLSRSGITIKSSFDVKPGTYLVRLVVRDGEGTQMAARNGAVVIPY